MRDRSRQDDQREVDRPGKEDSPGDYQTRWNRMSGQERIQHLLRLTGPDRGRETDKPVPTGWDAPDAKDHPRRPALETIRLTDDRRGHILDGDATGGGHRYGTGRPGKTEFPERWDDPTAIRYMLDVARRPDNAKLQDNGRWKATGTRDNVDLSIAVEADGRVWAAYPKAGGDGVIKNPKKQVDSHE